MESFNPANVRKHLRLLGGERGEKMLTEEALQAGKPSSLRHRSRLKHEFMMQMDHILDDSLRMYQILLYTVQLIFPASWRSKFTSS